MKGLRTHYCERCDKWFHHKGIMRHRKAHLKRDMGVEQAPMPKLRNRGEDESIERQSPDKTRDGEENQ
jgi:hypothetical protein